MSRPVEPGHSPEAPSGSSESRHAAPGIEKDHPRAAASQARVHDIETVEGELLNEKAQPLEERPAPHAVAVFDQERAVAFVGVGGQDLPREADSSRETGCRPRSRARSGLGRPPSYGDRDASRAAYPT